MGKCVGCGWQCERTFAFFCKKCGAVMEANYGSTTDYELFGLEPNFVVDLEQVEKAYKDLQLKLHPDKHAQASGQQRNLVEVHSARVNKAVATMRSPLKRAVYWMELNGFPVLQEEQRIDDMSTMTEVMEISEEVDEAESQAEIDALLESTKGKITVVETELDCALNGKNWDTARRLVERLKMLTRLTTRMAEWSPP